MDATHPTQATQVTRGWIKTGQDKAIKTRGSGTRLNLVGALSLDAISEAVVKRFEKVNSERIQDFLWVLPEQQGHTRKLHLILDGAGYHQAKAVKETAQSLNIELHYST